ncbi:MAG TPA: DUF1674 domain-containing protein [Acetobacteraceae bacterium]|nr:DUF1674 domain-containing protein [Acetobacteraceae bacterium]
MTQTEEPAADAPVAGTPPPPKPEPGPERKPPPAAPAGRPREIGGPSGPEPTRYNDWERKGRVSDF